MVTTVEEQAPSANETGTLKFLFKKIGIALDFTSVLHNTGCGYLQVHKIALHERFEVL